MTIADVPVLTDASTTIRMMTAADAAFDRQLFDEDRGAQFAPLGLDGPMLAMLLDQQFRAQQFGYQNEFPDAEQFVIEHAGIAVGRLTTALRGTSDDCALHVIYIVLAASARKRGIGTDVMNRLRNVARSRSATSLRLSVLRTNDGARRFYERLGFLAVADDTGAPHIALVKPLA